MKTIIAAALVALTSGTANAETTVCENLGGDRFVFTDDAASYELTSVGDTTSFSCKDQEEAVRLYNTLTCIATVGGLINTIVLIDNAMVIWTLIDTGGMDAGSLAYRDLTCKLL